MSKTVNCAIYTRKSTEDGLEQDFNSLDAQREACEAYIKSQKSEGWRLMEEPYDDGGCSGGNMNRPSMQKLLADVDAGKINVVVVYKVDRLTRSLLDFSRIVDRLDEKRASFVSVTQSFNTSTSMGRLTLNVLLSFAQFEREVTAERIRDKIAASKKKGMWMGGLVPLGYDAVDKKLVINQDEAETVRWLFQTYSDLGNVRCLKRAADAKGLKSKSRTARNGEPVAGSPFSRGQLYHVLKNPVYIGKVRHKDEVFKGLHRAIIERSLWEAVQQKLDGNAGNRMSDRNVSSDSWLNGLLYDDQDRRFSPSHTSKKGRRYRYYVTIDGEEESAAGGWRLPAPGIEKIVLDGIRGLLSDPVRTLQAVGMDEIKAESVSNVLKTGNTLGCDLARSSPSELAEVFRALASQVRVSTLWIEIDLMPDGLARLLDVEPTGASRVHTLTLPVQLKRRGVEMKLVLTGEAAPRSRGDKNLIRLVAKAHRWFEDLKSGQAKNISDIARREEMDVGDVSRALPLAFLAPDIVADIIKGDHPVDLTSEKLRRLSSLPKNWDKQRAALGFN